MGWGQVEVSILPSGIVTGFVIPEFIAIESLRVDRLIWEIHESVAHPEHILPLRIGQQRNGFASVGHQPTGVAAVIGFPDVELVEEFHEASCCDRSVV